MAGPLTTEEVLERARVAGVVIDPEELAAVVRNVNRGMSGLRHLDLIEERWSEPIPSSLPVGMPKPRSAP